MVTDREKLKMAKHILGVMETGKRTWKRDKKYKPEWRRSRDLAEIVKRIDQHIEDFSNGGNGFTLFAFEMALMQWGDELVEFLDSVRFIRQHSLF